MKTVSMRLIASVGALVLLGGVAWAAFAPPAKPYDPRPVMAEVEKRVTADKYTFVVMGDVKGSPDFAQVVAQAQKVNPTFTLLTGDMVKFTSHYSRLERQLGAFARSIPTWPCYGNHEADKYGGGPGIYKQFWGMDSAHYVFDFRNARFIAVEAPGRSIPNDLPWLEERLAEGQKAGKLMFVWQHVPTYTVGKKSRMECPGKQTAFTALLTKYGAVANFAGHDHTYYRTKRDGVFYFVQALGGAKPYPLERAGEAVAGDVFYGPGSKIKTASGEKAVEKPLMLTAIAVDGNKVTGKTYTADGDVVDEFILREAK
ncbi:MAG: metallophosphoesterase [Planctomycetaceae bacterium]|nr:metallophosphoesterase [Planctomycetaceae bacterium]